MSDFEGVSSRAVDILVRPKNAIDIILAISAPSRELGGTSEMILGVMLLMAWPGRR